MATAPGPAGPSPRRRALGALASLVGPPITMAVGAGVSAAVLLAVRLFSAAAFTLQPEDYRT